MAIGRTSAAARYFECDHGGVGNNQSGAIRGLQGGPYGTIFKPAVSFARVCDHGIRDLGCQGDVDTGARSADRRTGHHNHHAQHRLRRADIERLIAAYEEGNSLAQLVARFKVHSTTVLAHLEPNGVPRRPTGPKRSDEDVVDAADLYRDELLLAAVGHRFRVDPGTVVKAVRKAGVQIRPRRDWVSA